MKIGDYVSFVNKETFIKCSSSVDSSYSILALNKWYNRFKIVDIEASLCVIEVATSRGQKEWGLHTTCFKPYSPLPILTHRRCNE